MRRIIQTLFVLVSVLMLSGFTIPLRAAQPGIVVLNRNDQPVTALTDGDVIKLQVTLAQAATQESAINFLLEDGSTVGSCVIVNGQSTCIDRKSVV